MNGSCIVWTKEDAKRDLNLRKKYGITLVEYRVLLDAQDYACGICHGPTTEGRTFAVDHDHETGKVRGLLCTRCNVGLGYFKHGRNTLQSAIKYLDDHEALRGD